MPYPASYIPFRTFPGSKLLNLNLYQDDGSNTGVPGAPTGIRFLAQRPLLLESIQIFNPATQGNFVLWLLYGVIGGFTNSYQAYVDTSGVYGRGQDSPGSQADYSSQPVVPVSSGVSTGGQNQGAGGWMVYAHFVPVTPGSGQLALGAQLFLSQITLPNTPSVITTGSWQESDTGLTNPHNSCPFVLDLLNTQPGSGQVITPAVAFTVSSATSWNLAVNATDSSGETPRFLNFWAGAASWSAPNNTPALPAPVQSWTPASPTVSSSLLNGPAGIADVINFLQYPPMFRSAASLTTSIANQANTTQQLAATPSVDNFTGQQSTTGYVIQRDGLYLVHAVTCWGANSNGLRTTGITVNGTLYWGPAYNAANTGITMTTKTQIFSLRAGDVLSVTIRQNSGSSVSLSSTHQSRMFCTWLGSWTAPGSFATTLVPPDPAFRWQAGSAGNSLPGLFNQHLANDLGFLACHPYFLGYQVTPQSGLSQNSFHTTTLDTIQGIVHGDNGDPWGGWSSSNHWWAAPVAGWYLVCGELNTTAAGGGSVVAGLSVPTSGGFSPSQPVDYYQSQTATSNGAAPPAATIVGLYYLNAGEHIQPKIMGEDYGLPGTTFGTVFNLSGNGGVLTSHLEAIWISE